jgi:enterochelin esterase family protein
MTSDTLGRFYVTTALGVQVFDPTGRLCGVLGKPNPDKSLTSCVLSGPNRDLLYVTSGDKIFRRKVQAAGNPVAAIARMK